MNPFSFLVFNCKLVSISTPLSKYSSYSTYTVPMWKLNKKLNNCLYIKTLPFLSKGKEKGVLKPWARNKVIIEQSYCACVEHGAGSWSYGKKERGARIDVKVPEIKDFY
jgi:hypothetical protein